MDAYRWIVVGAGAVGGTIGGRLHQGGPTVFVARGAHGEALRADGLLLRDPDGEARLPVPTVSRVDEIDWSKGDVAIVATKTQDVEPVLDDLRAVAPHVPVVCATNGLDAERMALRRFAEVHGMCVMLIAAHLQPGLVEVSTAPCPGILDTGRATGGADDVDEALTAALCAGGFVGEADPLVMDRKRTKLLMNLANVVEAACGKHRLPEDLIAEAHDEGVAAFSAAGWSWRPDEVERRREHLAVRPVGGVHRGGGSTWQSLARGAGRTEADYLNGEIVLLGRLHGVPTPVNLALQVLAGELPTTSAAPESLTPDELRAYVDRRR